MIIAIPEALRERLGPEAAQALAELLNEARVQTKGDVIEIAASGFKRQLAEDVGGLRAEMHSEIGTLRSEMHSLIGGLRAEMHSEFGNVRAEMREVESRITRWMFVFWIGQLGALLGVLFAFFRT